MGIFGSFVYLLIYFIFNFSFSFSLSLSSALIIEIDYHYWFENRQLYLYSSDNDHLFAVTIDLLSNYTWLYPKSEEKITTINNHNNAYQIILQKKNDSFICNIMKGSFHFEGNINKTLKDIVYLQPIDKSPLSISKSHGSLGLSYYFEDQSYSIIHHLKDQGLISNVSFSIVNRNRFFFGGIPFNFTLNKTHSYCTVSNFKGNWTCGLDNVIMTINHHKEEEGTPTSETFYYNKNNHITFTTDNQKNFVPKGFFQFLIDQVYKDQIAAQKYKIFTYLNESRLYFYNQGFKGNIYITFVIEGFDYTINMWDFWICEDGFCNLNLVTNPNGDYWIVGTNFYYNFETMFDYDMKKVHFYSNKGITKTQLRIVGHSLIGRGQYALILNIFILVIGLILVTSNKLLIINKTS